MYRRETRLFFGQTAPEFNKKKPGFFFCPAHSKKTQKSAGMFCAHNFRVFRVSRG